MKFTIECEMNERWIPQFLGMLQLMETNGILGESEMIEFFSDGEGDYQPKFKWSNDLPNPAESKDKLAPMFDAG